MSLLQISEPIMDNQNEVDEIVIGIDLGTTNSLVGAVINDQLIFCDDKNGKNLINSKVVFDHNGDFVGVGNDFTGKYEIFSIKRIMGKNFAELKNLKNLHPSYRDLILDNTENNQAIALQIGNKKITAIEISALILKYLKEIAEKKFEKKISKAVITVPAYFDENAKNATKQSAKIAGLEVLRLLNEPTAGALAFGLDNKAIGTYLVYDLGGGTFDVSVLKITNGVLRVIGVAGDNNFGGDDIDELLIKAGFENAKEIKENLSFQDSYNSLTRAKFDEIIFSKIQNTIEIAKDLIMDLELDKSKLDGIILVGGSSRIPLISSELKKFFGDKILTNLDPDRIVAIGACYQAHNLSGQKNNLLLDVNPLSLGIEMMGGIVDKIIYRNSTIPISKSKEFTTYADYQTAMKFHIVQGERELAKNCRSLANFEVKNIPAFKAGIARVKITFTLDADGLLTITSEEKFTSQKQEVVVKPSFGLQENEVKNILLNSLEYSKQDIRERLLIESKVKINKDLELLKQDLQNSELNMPSIQKVELNKLIQQIEDGIAQNLSRDELNLLHDNLLKNCENIILQKVNQALIDNVRGKNIDADEFK
ncbi:MAG: Hsp70 family protein [Rickettsiales bacterium]